MASVRRAAVRNPSRHRLGSTRRPERLGRRAQDGRRAEFRRLPAGHLGSRLRSTDVDSSHKPPSNSPAPDPAPAGPRSADLYRVRLRRPREWSGPDDDPRRRHRLTRAARLESGQIYAASSSTAAGLVAFSELADSFDIWLLDVRGRPLARPFLQTAFQETSPALSPDGRWMAYDSNESGVQEVYVRPLTGEGKWHIPPMGARGRGGRATSTIARRRMRRFEEPPGPDRMMAVSVSATGSFTAGKPRVVAKAPIPRAARRPRTMTSATMAAGCS